jgi:hypothetical protein
MDKNSTDEQADIGAVGNPLHQFPSRCVEFFSPHGIETRRRIARAMAWDGQ